MALSGAHRFVVLKSEPKVVTLASQQTPTKTQQLTSFARWRRAGRPSLGSFTLEKWLPGLLLSWNRIIVDLIKSLWT